MYPPPEPISPHLLIGGIDDPLAEILWRAVRDLERSEWTSPGDVLQAVSSESAAGYREQLGYVVANVPELEEALGALANMRLNPGLVTLGSLARACEQIHGWAEAHGLPETALLFAESWGRLDPDNPIASNLAGRAARRTAHIMRAEVWFERAYKLAARHKNRRMMISALIGHGGLLRERGRYDEARSKFFDAARLAESTRRHRQAAEVQHELLTIAAEVGSYPEAEQYMLSALREYPIHHRALPWLGHDWAFFLIRSRLYREARVLLEAVRPHIGRRDLQVVVDGTMGRARAGCGDRSGYEECVSRVLALSALSEEYAAAALAHLAAGAQFFDDWDRGERMAERSIEIARARQQEDVERGAREILAALRQRLAAPGQVVPQRPNRLASIERLLLARLRQRTKPRRRKVIVDPEAGGRPDAPPNEGQPTGPRMDSAADG